MPKVDAKELEPCPGPERGKPCLRGEGVLADPAISGFDKVFRCVECHRVHSELAFREAGASAPNASDRPAKDAIGLPRGVDAARRAAMIARGAPRGGYTTPLPSSHRAPVQAAATIVRPPERETEEQRRARILAKYKR